MNIKAENKVNIFTGIGVIGYLISVEAQVVSTKYVRASMASLINHHSARAV